MKTLLTLLTCVFILSSNVVMGQSLDGIVQKGSDFLCKSTGVGCPESVDFKDLVERNGLYFKKFTDVPFTGKTTGEKQGSLNNGKMVGPWINYWSNGHLRSKGIFKDGKKNGLWVLYRINGQFSSKETYKNDKKIYD